jgi:hypothetical protein
MAHHINAIIFKKTDKISGGTSLPQDFIITSNSNHNRRVLNNLKLDYVTVSTNYFGGLGEQSAQYFKDQNGKKTLIKDFQRSERIGPINAALKLLGVNTEHNDAFDSINLGHYRDNEDFDNIINFNYKEPSLETLNKAKSNFDKNGWNENDSTKTPNIDNFYKKLEELQKDINSIKVALGIKI